MVKDVLSTSEAGIERYYLLELDSVNLLDLIFDKKEAEYFKLTHDNADPKLDEAEMIQEKYSNQRKQFRKKYLTGCNEDKKYHSESKDEEKIIFILNLEYASIFIFHPEIQFKEKASNAMVDYVKSYIEKSIPLRGIVKNRSIEQALPDICELHKHIFGKELIDTTKDR